jgi:hypothetical protein
MDVDVDPNPNPNPKSKDDDTRQEMFEQVISLLLPSHHLSGRGLI